VRIAAMTRAASRQACLNSQRVFRGLLDHLASTMGDGLALSSKRL
jgi:hypothetical protein